MAPTLASLRAGIAVGITIVLLLVFPIPAHSASISGEIDVTTDVSEVTFIGQRYVTIEYPSGSWFQQQLDGEEYRLSVSVNSSDSKVSRVVVSAFNEQFAAKGSDVRMDNAQVLYYIILEGAEKRARVFYNVEVNATLRNVVVSPPPANEEAMERVSIDLGWRDVNVNRSIPLDIENFSDLDINSPLGFISAYKPQVAQKLVESEQASRLLQQPLLNFTEIGAPLSEWKTTELGEDSFYISFGEAARPVTGLIQEEDPYPIFNKESVAATIDGSEMQITSETRAASAEFLVNSQNVIIVPEFPASMIALSTIALLSSVIVINRVKK